MALREQMEGSGSWLFRWRSYVPLAVLAVMLLSAGLWGTGNPFGSLPRMWVIVVAGLVSFAGQFVRAYAVGCAPQNTSGRNTRQQIADTLNTTGMYSMCRHPLYLGNWLMGLGVALLTMTWWLPVIYSLIYWIYYERIMLAEEAFLRGKFGEDYLSWAEGRPAFFPRLSGFTTADLPFSLKNVLRREYNGAFAVVLLFFVFEAVWDWTQGAPVADRTWQWGLGISTGVWLLLRAVKRRTGILDVAGR